MDTLTKLKRVLFGVKRIFAHVSNGETGAWSDSERSVCSKIAK